MRARKRRGFGWKRWSRRWLYEALGLFNDYRVRRTSRAESAPSAIGPITLGVKQAGKRSAGNPHAAFDVAGAGNGLVEYRASPRPYAGGGALGEPGAAAREAAAPVAVEQGPIRSAGGMVRVRAPTSRVLPWACRAASPPGWRHTPGAGKCPETRAPSSRSDWPGWSRAAHPAPRRPRALPLVPLARRARLESRGGARGHEPQGVRLPLLRRGPATGGAGDISAEVSNGYTPGVSAAPVALGTRRYRASRAASSAGARPPRPPVPDAPGSPPSPRRPCTRGATGRRTVGPPPAPRPPGPPAASPGRCAQRRAAVPVRPTPRSRSSVSGVATRVRARTLA